MCWSGEASAALAMIGLSTTAYAAYRKEPAALWGALAYFSLMEMLQAFTYSVIDQCSLPSNQIATFLGYIHIAFQPFFGNALFMYFIPDGVRRKISIYVYTLCAISSIVMLIQLYPFNWAGICTPGKILCARSLCSVSGQWHIAWNIPYNALGNIRFGIPVLDAGFFTYTLTMFCMPVLYGSWKMTLYHIFVGPMPALLLTTNLNEFAAVWCLLSIGLLIVVVKTPVRRLLVVSHWLLWPASLTRPS